MECQTINIDSSNFIDIFLVSLYTASTLKTIMSNSFLFNPKKWLGDAKIMSMDWDVRGMHIHLLSFAAQQNLKGFLPYDEDFLIKILNVDKSDWANRIKNQLLNSWDFATIDDENGSILFIYQKGLVDTFSNKTNTRTKKSKDQNIEKNNITDKNEIKVKDKDDSDKNTIWVMGVKKLVENNIAESTARGFLAKLIKKYGERNVASCIAQISIAKYEPAQLQSYMIGILNNEGKSRGRGSVSL